MTEEELNKKIIVDSQNNRKTMVKNYLKYYMKKRFIDFFLNKGSVSRNKTFSNMTKKDKNKKFGRIRWGMIGCEGINISEINPKAMESKLDKGKNLFFTGELLESHGPS